MYNYSKNDVAEEEPKHIPIAAIIPKYSPLLYTVLFLLLIDLSINAFSELAATTPIALLIVYM